LIEKVLSNEGLLIALMQQIHFDRNQEKVSHRRYSWPRSAVVSPVTTRMITSKMMIWSRYVSFCQTVSKFKSDLAYNVMESVLRRRLATYTSRWWWRYFLILRVLFTTSFYHKAGQSIRSIIWKLCIVVV